MPARFFTLATALLVVAPAVAQIPTELLYTVYSPNGPFTNLGTALAPFPDVDADGTPDFLVGAFAEIVLGQELAGRAYIVSGATGAILQTFEGPPVEDADFGWSVAHAGDLDGDGSPDAVVGSFLYPGPGAEQDEGRVYLVSGATGDVLDVVDATDPEAELGYAVAGLFGDVDGDGVPDVMASQTGIGSVVVSSGATGAVLREIEVEDNSTTPLGVSLAVLDDLTGDGVREIAVGAPVAPGNPQYGLGRVYVLDPATGALVYTIANPANVPDQLFGDRRTLAAVGDLDGDGLTDLAVGAPNAQRPDGQFGYVHLFSGATGALLRSCDAAPNLGRAVTHAGDLDGDGTPDVLASGGGSGAANGVVAVSGATCAVLLAIPSPFVTALGFPAAITAIRPAAASDATLVAIGAAGSLPGESEITSRVFVYRVGEPVASAPAPASSGLSVSVAPNPSSGAASATVSLAEAQAVRVSVVDALGRTVAVLHDGPVSAGRLRLALPAGLAAGVYAVVAESSGAVARARWVMAR